MRNKFAELIRFKEMELENMKREVAAREDELAKLREKSREAEEMGAVRRAVFEFSVERRIAKLERRAPRIDDVRTQKGTRKGVKS